MKQLYTRSNPIPGATLHLEFRRHHTDPPSQLPASPRLSKFPRRLTGLRLLVETDKYDAEGVSTSDGDAKHGQDDAVTLWGSVLIEVPDVGAGNVALLAEAIDHDDGFGVLCWQMQEESADPRVKTMNPAYAPAWGKNAIYGVVTLSVDMLMTKPMMPTQVRPMI